MGRERILLVDDEPNILNSLRRELSGWSAKNGVTLAAAPSGAAALSVLCDGGDPVAVIVSDVRMPEMKGTDLLLRVRQDHPAVVTILLSGYADIEEVMKGIKAGVFSYIMKPWNADYLQAEIAKALHVYRLQENVRLQQEHIRKELAGAGRLQRTLLSVDAPSSDRLGFHVTYKPMQEFQCGGDFYDVIAAAPGRYFFVIGDVAGHGVRAALVTAVLRCLIHTDYLSRRRPDEAAPGDFLTWMNGRIARDLEGVPDIMVSCSALDVDTRAMRLRYASAGHPPFLHLHGGDASPVRQEGPALGIIPELSYAEASRPVEAGDILLLYTDGILEVGRCAAGDGLERLVEVSRREAGSGSFNDSVIQGVLSACGAAELSDDLAMISIRIA
jgi:sigma-B regulation protein RsbU (phosphoserine phosphatase)